MISRYQILVKLGLLMLLCMMCFHGAAQNKPEHEAWLQDAGFGMFIHWSLDAQLGTVISHSMVGASDEYVDWYLNELPQTFNPEDFKPERIATLARLAGMKYMVFTTKHHNGFCMWDTKTTDFNVMETPYQQDIVKQYVDACRAAGLKVGLYFSPEDFLFLHEHGEVIKRRDKDKISAALKEEYIAYTQAQCKELLTQYGDIDIMFFDGKKNFLIDALKPFCWELNPDLLVTRGEIITPEQHLPGVAADRVWETCMTMGTQWQFKPTNESYKSGLQVIKILTETRAKGGSLLLNVGPDAYGEIPFEQDRNLREVATWKAINKEALEGVRPWIVTHEGNIWFTRKKDANTVYAVLFGQPDWPRGERREFMLHSVEATDETRISVLGQNDKIVEYQAGVPDSRFKQTEDGLQVSVVRAQRIYNNHKWPNPIIVKLENVAPALLPPAVLTAEEYTQEGKQITLGASLLELGDAAQVEVGFEYRLRPNSLNALNDDTGWIEVEAKALQKPSEFSAAIKELAPATYQYRAFVKHPKLKMLGDTYDFQFSD